MRMKSFFFSLAVLVIVLTEAESSPCDGCSHTCFDRNDGNGVQCGCPCGMQISSTDSKLCETTDPCENEVYIMIDTSSYTAKDECDKKNNGQAASFTGNFKIWKQSVITALEFLKITDTTKYYVEVMDTDNQPAQAWETPLTKAEEFMKSLTAPGSQSCGGSKAPGEFDEQILSLASRVTLKEDRSKTTRIAVLMISETSAKTDEQINTNFKPLRDNFDSVLVITRSVTTSDAHLDLMRSVACGRTAVEPGVKCPNLFFIDKENDYDVVLSQSAVYNTIYTEKCKENAAVAQVTSCSGTMQVTIPKCLLAGYEPKDLQFIDDTCKVEDVTEDKSDNYLVKIPFMGCSTNRVANKWTKKVFYTQKLTQRSTLTSFHPVEIEAKCETSMLLKKTSPSLKPLQNHYISTTTFSGKELEKVTFSFFQDAEHTTPLVLSTALATGSKVYVVAESKFQTGIKLILQRLVVTDSTSPDSTPKHTMLDNFCPVDTTVKDIKSESDSKISFNFEMFEFSTTQNTETNGKAKLYFHPTFKACPPSSADADCQTPSCSGRKKRSVMSESDPSLITYTFGPYFVAKKSPIKQPSFTESVSEFFNSVKDDFLYFCNLDAFGVLNNLMLMLVILVSIYINKEVKSKLIAFPKTISTIYNGMLSHLSVGKTRLGEQCFSTPTRQKLKTKSGSL